ncbi:ABC transporter permease [Streptomyces sp. NBC_01190]|uniref:ABC transporter permease n=1 Tax=Streptomyces sp. NBC_01190 TaxID=2903767 RepID=UPI00386F51AF|nr:ABC transporter permease [Streptomyces sp. NBC_01190]
MKSPDTRPRDVLWVMGGIAAFGWRSFRSLHPPLVLALTILPRAVLQSCFFVLLGRWIGSTQQAGFALTGAAVITMPVMCTSCVADVVTADKWSGTLWRLRSARVSPTTVMALRAWPYAVSGWSLSLAAALIAAPLTGHAGLTRQLLEVAPLYAVIAVTMTVAGLAVTAVALGKRADVVLGNLLAYLIILATGTFLPSSRLGFLRPLGWVLPGTHGLAAARALEAGGPWFGQVAAEAGVGAGWCLVAWVVITGQLSRIRRSGHDFS